MKYFAISTVGRAYKLQHGDRVKDEQKPMFTLTSNERHGVVELGGDDVKIIQRGHGYNQGGEKETAPAVTSNSYEQNNLLAEPAPLMINNATKKGYLLGGEGDSVDLRFPDSKTRRARVGKQRVNTLQCDGQQNGVITKDGSQLRIRRLTPRECWRLQGFPDEYYDRAANAGVSETQLYKQAGNAVTVTVARAIGEKLKEAEMEGKND